MDCLWLGVLVVYAWAGMMLAPFHGDEAMHIYTSHDYATAFIKRQPEVLPVTPPYDLDSDTRLRLLNGSVMRYSIGLAWHLAGLTEEVLPPAPGWDWGLFYADNIAKNQRPIEPLLQAGRTAALVYFTFSIVAMFGIGWHFGGRVPAYAASALYTLNPIILLNGRRSLVESALLCFGLLLIFIALQIARRRWSNARVGALWWGGLSIAAALTLASKYSGTIFVAAAYGGLFLVEVARIVTARRTQKHEPLQQGFIALIATTAWLTVSGVVALLLLLAISPALWNDPLSRVRDLGAMLGEQVDIVVSILPNAPTSLSWRVGGMVTQPFLTAPQFFEQAAWNEAAPIADEIMRYLASPLSGVQFGLLGIPLTLLAGVGLLALCWPRLRPFASGGLSVLLLAWLAVTLANLLINPLPWQRYYLLLLPITSLLAALGLAAVIRLIKQNLAQRREQARPQSG